MITQFLLVSISFALSLPSFALPFPYTSISPFLLFQSLCFSFSLSHFQQLMSNNFGDESWSPTYQWWNKLPPSLLPELCAHCHTAFISLDCKTSLFVGWTPLIVHEFLTDQAFSYFHYLCLAECFALNIFDSYILNRCTFFSNFCKYCTRFLVQNKTLWNSHL